MACPGDGSVGDRRFSWLFRNWARTRSFSVPLLFRPRNVEEIVAGVEEVESLGGVLRAVGSGWSYTDVALTPEVSHVMDLSLCNAILNGRDIDSTATLLPNALNDGSRSRASFFVHVEAGIKIHDLNCQLDGRGRAMATLGGSNGQALAGVLSTATHGSEVDLPPIADSVRAIHLVGPGGQEWWIEPAGDESITDEARMTAARDRGRLCADIRIEYDTRLFNAVLVSAGRMGIIYSVVVEVVEAFSLEETRDESTWSAASRQIRDTVMVPSGSYRGPRFLEFVLSPYANAAGERVCVVTQRNVSTAPLTPDPPPSPDVFGFLCNLQWLTPILLGLLALVPGLIAGATAAALGSISWIAAIPIVGGALFAVASTVVVTAATAGLISLQTALTAFLVSPGENIAEKLANICNLAVQIGQKQIVPQLINEMVGFIRSPIQEPIVGQSFRIMTGQDPCGSQWQDSPNCMREIDGLEFAVDASPGTTTLFDFMDDVFALVDEFYAANRPPGLGLSLRFTRATRALIGMQQYERTCSIEFIMLRGFSGHGDFRRRLYAIARRHRAIPHWGLIHEIDGAEVYRLYGRKHTDWRMELTRLIEQGGGQEATFRTSFSVARDLEPLPSCTVPPAIVRFLRTILTRLARARGLRGVADTFGQSGQRKG